jgi:hypothetical protein
MSFLSGSVTATRFLVTGDTPPLFDEDHLDRLRDRQIGRQREATSDGVEAGWTAGASVLDTAFSLEKQVVNDAMCFDYRADTDKPPQDLFQAYVETAVAEAAKSNPSGFASARQKKEAKEDARTRLAQEGKDGRFKKRKRVPVLWDRDRREVLFGDAGTAHLERFVSLFESTFGVGLSRVTAAARALFVWRSPHALGFDVDAVPPSRFVAGPEPDGVAWLPEGADFLGNEFLLWLWYTASQESDTVLCPDGREVTFMLREKLVLEDPRGLSGTDGFRTEGPDRLPEALRAAQAGKLPRRAGLTLVRDGGQFELTLDAESMAIRAGRVPPTAPEAQVTPRGRLEDRVGRIRDMLDAVDQLYAAFVGLRLGGEWALVLPRMQQWLARPAAAPKAA